MKKSTIFTVGIFLLGFSLSFAQDKYITKNGAIDFEASVASFEEVKAKNENVTGILNTANGDIAALALMRGFRFKVALMEEHFNENYMESEEYPKATFKGKLEGFSAGDLSSSAKEYPLKGSLTLHGKTKEINTTAKVSKSGDVISFTTSFRTKPQDFAIDIPKVVSNKIAKEINVVVDFEMKKR
ncbi:YceI family protein [Spongiimicrobium salis]|uniref:YceI family protein n=1 Tax=Spongiimicrobium salis TaxID=1667022 RepID=UPI00374D6D64